MLCEYSSTGVSSESTSRDLNATNAQSPLPVPCVYYWIFFVYGPGSCTIIASLIEHYCRGGWVSDQGAAHTFPAYDYDVAVWWYKAYSNLARESRLKASHHKPSSSSQILNISQKISWSIQFPPPNSPSHIDVACIVFKHRLILLFHYILLCSPPFCRRTACLYALDVIDDVYKI